MDQGGMSPGPSSSCPYSPKRVERLSEKVLSGVSIAHLTGTQQQNQGYFVRFWARRTLSQSPTRLFGQSRSSTLAIWPSNTPYKLGLLRRPLGLFAGHSPAATRKNKSP